MNTKKLLSMGLLVLTIISCKKTNEKTNDEDARLVSTISYDDQNMPFTTNLEYDAGGRIIKLSSSLEPQASINVKYVANDAIITQVPMGANDKKEIRFTLNQMGKPVKRTETSYTQYSDGNYLQKDYVWDTTNYEYDNAGLLIHSTRTRTDSTWYDTGNDIQTSWRNERFSINYVNAGMNLQELHNTSTVLLRSSVGTTVSQEQLTSENNFTYAYDKKYGNKTDLKNAFILTEFGILTWSLYPLNSSYANFPNRIVEASVEKDVDGIVQYSYDFTSDIEVKYNSTGLISTINNNPLKPYPTSLNYNK